MNTNLNHTTSDMDDDDTTSERSTAVWQAFKHPVRRDKSCFNRLWDVLGKLPGAYIPLPLYFNDKKSFATHHNYMAHLHGGRQQWGVLELDEFGAGFRD